MPFFLVEKDEKWDASVFIEHRRTMFIKNLDLTVLLPLFGASHQVPFSVGTLVNLMGHLQKVLSKKTDLKKKKQKRTNV